MLPQSKPPPQAPRPHLCLCGIGFRLPGCVGRERIFRILRRWKRKGCHGGSKQPPYGVGRWCGGDVGRVLAPTVNDVERSALASVGVRLHHIRPCGPPSPQGEGFGAEVVGAVINRPRAIKDRPYGEKRSAVCVAAASSRPTGVDGSAVEM